jgi:hypothetical protein
MLVSTFFVHNTNSRYYFPAFKESIAIKKWTILILAKLLLEGMLSFMLFAGASY